MKNKTLIIHKLGISFYAILVAVIFCGCETINVTVEETITRINGRHISIYVVDSCEYIGNIYGGHGDWATHKGNCKFCAERSKN